MNLKMSSAICFNLDQSKILSSGNGLTLPNDKFLFWSKLKASTDDISNVAQMTKFVLDRLENIVGKGENAGHLFQSESILKNN